MEPSPSRTKVWLQLLRAPNLFTVPGDPLAGYLLAARELRAGELLPAVLASLCFYSGGLLMNDLADSAEDRRERPGRPLPSGAASVRAVQRALGVLLGAGLVFCALESAAALAAGGSLVLAITGYNLWSKRLAGLGALNMGLCRGLNLLLGAAFAGSLPAPVAVAALLTTAYIAAVTHLARRETHAAAPGRAQWLPLAVLAGGGFVWRGAGRNAGAFYIFYMLAVAAVREITARLRSAGAPALPPFIGAFIRALLFVQAAFCAASAHGWRSFATAAALLALVPISHLVGRRFYAS